MFESMARSLDNTVELNTKLKCLIEEHCWKSIVGWCQAARSEVSGMGLCKIEKGVFKVYKVFFPLQYCSTGYTELDDRALAKLQIGLYKKKIPANHFRFWWHTHYNFNVFWSGTDDNNATTLARANGEWELSLVINQAREYRCRADYFRKPHPMIADPIHVLVDNIEVFTIPNTKRQRHKPNFKRDVKRFVKDMSELPEKQKPKTTTSAAPQQVYDYTKDDKATGSYHDEFSDWWNDKLNKSSVKEDKEEKVCNSCYSRYCKNYMICQDNPAKRDEAKKKEPFEDGNMYGGYVWLGGLLVSQVTYRKHLADQTGESEPIDELVRRVGADEPKEVCQCGNSECVSYDKCIHCDLCQQRFDVESAVCVGCEKAYDLMQKGEKIEIPESGGFNQ